MLRSGRPWTRVAAVVASAVAAALTVHVPRPAHSSTRPNVLFIVCDDMRPQLGCTGDPQALTPHIDALAQRGVAFRSAFAAYPLCCPSRSSFLTGRRPDRTGVLDQRTSFRRQLPNAVTLPQAFKEAGYWTQEFGKVFQTGEEDPASWSAAEYGNREHPKGNSPAWAELPDDSTLVDRKYTDHALSAITELSRKGKPWFVAVGIRHPHVPFLAPKQFWDEYPLAGIHLPDNLQHPENAPECAWNRNCGLSRFNPDLKHGPQNEEEAQQMMRGYLASTSYADSLVGELTERVDSLGLRSNTIVVVLGDNGLHVGEHGVWCTKMTLYDTGLQVALVVSIPGSAHGVADGLVELLDLYPTLCDACKVRPDPHIEGKSLAPLLADPTAPGKDAVWGQFSRVEPGQNKPPGRTVRTPRYRYVEWEDNGLKRELYDHATDPEENINVAHQPEYALQVAQLAHLLRQE